MKLIQILFFLLLLQNQYLYADSESKKGKGLLLNLPNIGKLDISLNQDDCDSKLCDTSLNINWTTKRGSSNQQLLKDDYPRIYKVFTDEDGLIVSSFGNKYDSEEYRYYERFRYSEEENTFYKAETWKTDDWTGYIMELDELLKIGAFKKARELVSEKGVTPNGGHTFQDVEIFSKFVSAVHREAKRAKELGYDKVAGKLVLSLLDMPFQHEASPPTNNFYNFSNLENKGVLKHNILEINKENTALVNDFSTFLSDSEYFKNSIFLLNQITRYNPKILSAWKASGDVYLSLSKQDEARNAYNMYFKLMKEKGLEDVVSDKILQFINHKRLPLKSDAEEKNKKTEIIPKIIWYDGYISEYPIKVKMVIKNESIHELSYAYDKTKKWINLLDIKNSKEVFQATEKRKGKTTGFWELTFQAGTNIKGHWKSPIGRVLPILLKPQSKQAETKTISISSEEANKVVLVDINYDGYLDLIKSNPTLRKGSTTKKYYSHSVYVFNEETKSYKFTKELSYFSYETYINIENYNLFNKRFRACNRSRKNPKRSRKCWNFHTGINVKTPESN